VDIKCGRPKRAPAIPMYEFWYFTVVLARFLQRGENPLEESEAYWLGICDEVVGTPLIGMRAVAEENLGAETPDTNNDNPKVVAEGKTS
jgi:hypothetical protein